VGSSLFLTDLLTVPMNQGEVHGTRRPIANGLSFGCRQHRSGRRGTVVARVGISMGERVGLTPVTAGSLDL
jgi:hypothetical protein